MPKVCENPTLKKLNSNLIKKYSDALIIESNYRRLSEAYKVVTKVPPAIDRSLREVNDLVICNLSKDKATFIKVPKHFTKISNACGVKIIQNFFVSAEDLGKTMEIYAYIERRVNRNGLTAYVINYCYNREDSNEVEPLRLKIGTNKRYPGEVKVIELSNDKFISFIKKAS